MCKNNSEDTTPAIFTLESLLFGKRFSSFDKLNNLYKNNMVFQNFNWMMNIENPISHVPLFKYAKEKQVKLNEENIYRNFSVNPFKQVKGLVSCLEYHPVEFGKYLAVHNTMVDIFNDEDEVQHSYSKFGGIVHSASFRKDGIVLVAGDEEGKIRLLRTDTSSTKRLNVPLRNFVAHQA